MHRSRRLLLAAATVVSLGTLAAAGTATAATSASSDAAPAVSVATADPSDGAATDDTSVMVDDTDWQAEANAEANALDAFLTARGIEHTVTTDADGWVSVDYDWEDQATNDAVDDFYWQQYPWTQDEIDAYNTEARDLVAYLQAHGIDATIVTDRHGLEDADYQWTEAVDDVIAAYYGDIAVG